VKNKLENVRTALVPNFTRKHTYGWEADTRPVEDYDISKLYSKKERKRFWKND
jgi:hypothetical protein